MPAQSQQQQKLFGLALSVKRGETSRSEASEDVLGIVDSMSEKEIEDFAGTSHKGLPKKVEEYIREEVRRHINENIPRMYKVYLGVQNKLRKLEDEQKKMLGQFKDEKDPKKKRNILDKMKDGTVRLKKVRANLADIEREYINKASYDTSYSENIKISKAEMDKLHSDGEVEVDGEKVTFEEGKKRFRQQDGIGKAKYTISYHDGKQKHKDGSDFFGIQIFKNKKDLETFRNTLLKKGYIEESVNEGIEPQIKKIAHFTGTRPEAVEDFVSKHALNITKLLKYVQKGGLPQRMELVSALAGRPNNPKQKKIIKQFQESINEVNTRLNKKVKSYLDAYLKGEKKNSSEHQHAIMLIMKGALTDANFHSEARQLDKFFPKAKQSKHVGTQMEDVIEDKGVDIAKWAKWDGYDIIDAFSFYTNMVIGGGFGNKLTALKESLNEEFKSKDSTFEKVYGIFDKRDYFNAKGLAKVKIGNFERALQKNDKGAQQILDKFKGDMDKAKEYIIQVISDQKKQQAFENFKALKMAVDSIQKGKPEQGAVGYVKRIIHNNNQKYSIALYSALRNQKFTKWKDIHNDIDSLIK